MLAGWLQVSCVIVLTLVGSTLGALTRFAPLSPILGMALPLVAATAFLRREGLGWRQLGLARRLPLSTFLRHTGIALGTIYLLNAFVVTPLVRSLGAPPADVSVLSQLIEGDLITYLWFLLPISWGSAAFGEEMLARGFLQHRFERLYGGATAIVLQALIFAAGHFYQGITGMANVFVIGLVMGTVYVRCGRNLWPLIVAHGIIDTIGITALYLGYADFLSR